MADHLPAPPLPAATGTSAPTAQNIAASEGHIWPAMQVEDILPRPVKRHHINDDVAEMLATLPRKRWDESTWAALGGAAAAFPSAADALHSAYERTPFSLHAFELVQVTIFLGFLIWFFARQRSKGEKTSGKLLEELRSSNSNKTTQGTAGGA
jgi:hypothetical protein